MGTKFDRFEESTKITSSSEINEILKQTRVSHHDDDDDDDAHFNDFGESTKIGNVQELVAQSMTIDEPPPPPPVLARSMSQNVIRRDSAPMAIARTSDIMPAVRAQGSLSDITALPPEPEIERCDADAFDPWEEKPVDRISQPLPIVSEPELAPMPVVSTMPEPPEPQKRGGVRWGVVAWFMLLAATIGAGTVGYMRIAQLEGELAQAKAELQIRAKAR